MGILAFPADKELVVKAKEAARKAAPDIGVFEGRVCSGDQFISSPEVKQEIIKEFGGLCTEMEGAAIAQVCHEGKEYVRNPCCQHRWGVGFYGECCRHGLQQNIRETECEPDAEIESHSAFTFSRSERETDDGEYERSKRRCNALVILHLILHYVARSSVYLFRDIFLQFWTCECLLLSF